MKSLKKVSAEKRYRYEVWQKPRIIEAKSAIRTELQSLSSTLSEKELLRLILQKIQSLQEAEDSDSRLNCYVYVLAALLHHARFGGLSPRQIESLPLVATAILRTQGVNAESTRNGYLYGELHLILSQIFRREGRHWRAAWEHQVASHVSRGDSASQPGFYSFTLGIRAIRLGNTELGLRRLQESETEGLGPEWRVRARLEFCRALRFQQRFSEAREIKARTLHEERISAEESREFSWEELCIKSQETRDISSLIFSTRKNKEHCTEEYVIEAFYWSRLIAERDWLVRFPTVKSFFRCQISSSLRQSHLWKYAKQLEHCYDSSIPLLHRLETMGSLFEKATSLFSIDSELLLQASALRWLFRAHAHDLREVLQHEYMHSSYKVSGGRVKDLFGLMGDVLKA